jgi:uncharacterized protein DUF7009
MKLRIKGDSLRIRVTQGELDSLTADGHVEESIHFGPSRALAYRLAIDPQVSELTARFDRDVIEVRLPEQSARQWSATNQVTLENVQTQDGMDLKIFVEKDFACLQPREGEDESDNFPHPAAGTGATC